MWDDSFDSSPTSPRNLASPATESLPYLHLKTQSDYPGQNDAEHVMITLTTPMRHSPAFDILATSGASCPHPVLGVDRGRSPKTHEVRRTQRRQRSFECGQGNLLARVIRRCRSIRLLLILRLSIRQVGQNSACEVIFESASPI